MSTSQAVRRARLLKKLKTWRQTARLFGMEPLRELDADKFDNDLLPVVPYAELFAGDWGTMDIDARLELATEPLIEQLASIHIEYSQSIADWLNANIQWPTRPWERLSYAEQERIWLRYPRSKGYAAHWSEQQSVEYHAIYYLDYACRWAFYELNPPSYTRRS